jgi:hypothetical protein
MKKIFISFCLIALIAILPAPLFAEDFTFKSIRFFEAGDDAPEASQRVYMVQFPKSTTRFVWCQIDVENLLYNVREQTHKVVWRYYNSDSTLRGEMHSDFTIKPTWYTSWIQHGWGLDKPGNWLAGTYRAEVWIDGRKIGQDLFTIYDDVAMKTAAVGPSVDDKIYLTYKSVKFFEGPTNTPPPEENQYKNRFPKGTTRYIYFSVFGDNLLYKNRVHKPLIIGRYYKSDGTFLGEAKIDKVDVLTDWDEAELWTGWGWDAPGNWSLGTYRVEIIFGNTKVGEENFTIYDDRAPSDQTVTSLPAEKVYLEFQFVKFFEGGSTVPSNAEFQYKVLFPKSTTRYVYFLVGARNLLYGTRVHKPLIIGRFYNPDGSLRGEAQVNKDIQSDWKEADLWNGWGWDTPGNWPVGTYRVEIFFGNTKVAEERFSVFDDKK